MAFTTPTAWSSGTAYTIGQQVIQNGVVYEAIVATSAEPRISTDWVVVAVRSIEDYTSLVEAIRLQINVDDSEVNESVPLFIQLAEQSFNTRMRVPAMRREIILTTDDDSRIQVPGDLLEVINLRTNETASSGPFRGDIRARGSIEILNANYEEYQRVLQYGENNYSFNRTDSYAFDSPVFFFDSQYFNIAPAYDQGTEMELWYYASVPFLGTTVALTDAAGNAVNAARQTLAQWIAAGNAESTFVQDTETVETNFWTGFAPQMLLYGALCKSEAYLKDHERMEIWKVAFAEAQAETQDAIFRFESSQPHTLFLENAYSAIG